jgi:hypothetical protein
MTQTGCPVDTFLLSDGSAARRLATREAPMPWKETRVVDERMRFIAATLEDPRGKVPVQTVDRAPGGAGPLDEDRRERKTIQSGRDAIRSL